MGWHTAVEWTNLNNIRINYINLGKEPMRYLLLVEETEHYILSRARTPVH